LIRRFDPTITAAHELPELKAKLKRLADAMANALEAAHRTGKILAPILKEIPSAGNPEGNPDGNRQRNLTDRQAAIEDYTALAAGGPALLLEAAADPHRSAVAIKTMVNYETLAVAAAAAPRLWAMREYLQATGLRWGFEHSPLRDAKVAALETECQLLQSQLNPAVLLGEHHNLDALQARAMSGPLLELSSGPFVI
jgi:hypothetical protein